MTFRRIEELIEQSKDHVKLIQQIIRDLRAKVYVEIGVWKGDTISKIKCENKIGIDVNELLGDFIFITGKAHEQKNEVSKLIKRIGRIDVLYQDSSHHFEESKREWEAFRPMMRPGGVWICDDITTSFHDPDIDPPCKSMVNYFEEIPENNKRLYPNVLHKGSTQGIILL